MTHTDTLGIQYDIQKLKNVLNALGYNVLDVIESIETLRDYYGIEIAVPSPAPTVQELALEMTQKTLKQITKLEICLPKKQQTFSREQLKHFNNIQNTRLKTYNQRHR